MTTTTEPTPFEVADRWWVERVVQEIRAGRRPPHLRGTCASCDDARRRTEPIVEQLPLRDEVSAAHDHDCYEVADAQPASPLAEPWNEGGRT